jgi:hypothetical protein
MRSLGFGLGVFAFLPRVENPWPHTIDLSLPFTLASAFAVLAAALNIGASRERRDRAISRAGFAGLLLGVALYWIALLVQLGSSL